MSASVSSYSKIAFSLLAGGSIALVICVGVYAAFLHSQGLSPLSSDWGTFGDFVGGIAGTIISLATLAALAVNIQLQSAELEETRTELRNQAKTLALENVEATLFRLLTSHRENVKFLSSSSGHGRAAVTDYAKNLADITANATRERGFDLPVIQERAQRYLNQNRHLLDAFLGSASQLLRYALRHKDSDGNIDYLALVLADFTIAERVLLLFVGLTDYGKRFALDALLKDSGMFKGMANNEFSVVIPQEALNLYDTKDGQ